MKNYTDICLNLMNRQYEQEQDAVVARAVEAGVEKMIVTGTSIPASVQAAKFVQKYPDVLYATAGIHPHDAKRFTSGDLETLKQLVAQVQVVAVGECGLDFDRMNSSVEAQERCFIAQLELAKETGKPLLLHERGAHERFVEIMEGYPELIERSVVHCFTGTKEEMLDYLDRGFYLGITGWICDKSRGEALREAVKHLPLDRVMIETDGPYLVPKDLKPRPKPWRNEPKYLPHIAKTLAEFMDVPEEALIQASTQNAKRFFGI